MADINKFFATFWKYAEQAKRHTTTALFVAFTAFILFVFFISSVIGFFSSEDKGFSKNTALLLNLDQPITEQAVKPSNLMEILDSLGSKNDLSSLDNILQIIELAKQDDKITGIVLSTEPSFYAGISKLKLITAALKEFKAKGKKIFAISPYYSQEEYFLASVADKIYLNSIGGVEITGYARYRTYMKSALDKLKITMNIFRVGTYKSALEPFFRNDMSEEAKEANLLWINALWTHYKTGIETNRAAVTSDVIQNYTDTFETLLLERKGSLSQLALDMKMVDEIADQSAIEKFLKSEFGEGKKKKVYNFILPKELAKKHSKPSLFESSRPKIGIVIVQGTIKDGEESNENAGGDSVYRLIKQAEEDDEVKALLLRVDSGGGSVFASEQIRSAIVSFKNSGRPVFASFGSMAASGGYWIATPAEEIWCEPTTLTGSIGIFGAIPTFENVASFVGLNADGVATSELAESYHPFRALPTKLKSSFQLSIENGYAKFLDLVAQSRKMSVEDVDKIAQGRVWSGEMALQHGLVDHLGTAQDAIKALASRAKLTLYDVEVIEKELKEEEKLFQDILENIQATTDTKLKLERQNQLEVLIKKFGLEEIKEILFNDPHHAYAYSLLSKAP